MLKKYQAIIAGLVFAVIGLGIGYGIGKLLKGTGQEINIGLALIPITILVLWCVLAAHELGHVLGGLMSGFTFYLFAVGPLRIHRTGTQLEVVFNRTPSLWGGIAACIPDPSSLADNETLRKQMLWMVSGGPLASLLGTLAFFPAQASMATSKYLAVALLIFSIGSFCIAFVTMLPIGNSGFVNDGARILQLLRRDASGDRWLSGALLGSMSLMLRPREWPAHLVEANTNDLQPTYDGIMAMWTRFSYHLDRDEIAEASHWLNLALSHADTWPAAARPILHNSAAFFYSHIEPDLPRARDHLKEAAKPGFLTKDSLALSEAAVLLAEGKRDEARQALNLARQSLNSLSGSSRASVEELLGQLEAKTH